MYNSIMRQSSYILFAALLLASCSTNNRIIDTTDDFKEVSGFKLTQTPQAILAVPKVKSGRSDNFNVTLNYYYDEIKNSNPHIILEARMLTLVRPNELDSVMFLDLDNEKVRLVSKSYQSKQFDRSSTSVSTSTTTAVREKTAENADQTKKDSAKEVLTTTTHTTESDTNSYQMMSREFSIPENLWEPIAYTSNIRMRLYFGRDGIDVKPNHSENERIREFFYRANQQRKASVTPLPDGKKKW